VQQFGIEGSKHSFDGGLVVRSSNGRVLGDNAELQAGFVEAGTVILLSIINDYQLGKS